MVRGDSGSLATHLDGGGDVHCAVGSGRTNGRLYRTQILLEPEQQRALAERARTEGRSVSDLVREMIREQLSRSERAVEAARKRRLVALERIHEHREAILERRAGMPVDVADLIESMREERDEQALRAAGRR